MIQFSYPLKQFTEAESKKVTIALCTTSWVRPETASKRKRVNDRAKGNYCKIYRPTLPSRDGRR